MAYETRYRDVTREATLGYDPVPIHRPKFIFFKFTGLRPNIPHWLFFGGREITRFANTSYTEANYTSAGRNSKLKEPGETFIDATGFPSGGGLAFEGPTSSGGPTGPLTSDDQGILKGVFYLQSNNTLSFPIVEGGHQLVAIDISKLDKTKCKSFGTGVFNGIGQYENFYQYTETESYEVWVEPPPSVQNVGGGGGGGGGDDGNDSPKGWYHVHEPGGIYNYYGDMGPGSHYDVNKNKNADYDWNGKSTAGNYASREGRNDDASNDDCVIATHGIKTGGFSPLEKAKAEIWCKKKYHDKFFGEAFRRGYRNAATKAVERGEAAKYYNEFKDFVAYGRGRKKGWKLAINYYYRTFSFIINGLLIKES